MIRALTFEDVPGMLPLGEQFFSYAKLPGKFNSDRFAAVWTKLISDQTGLVQGYFDVNEELRGAAGAYVMPDSMTSDVVAYEAFFYVDPAFRGRGPSLLKALEAAVISAGVDRLWMVHLNDDRAPSMQRYYERCGFNLREFLYLKVLK